MAAYIYTSDAGVSMVSTDLKGKKAGIRPKRGITVAVRIVSSDGIPTGAIVTVPVNRLTPVS